MTSGGSQVFQPLEATSGLVEAKCEHILSILDSIANEAPKVSLVGDLQGHLSTRPGHLEFKVTASLLGGFRKVKGDVAEREAEVDLLLLDTAAAQDGQGLGSHGHGHVHGSNTLKVGHYDRVTVTPGVWGEGR